MSKSSLLAENYIRGVFSPQVAVLCSEDADNVCLKNNLCFVELLQPYIKSYPEAQICDPGGNGNSLKNFKIVFEDMNRRPPQPIFGKKILQEAVRNAAWNPETFLKLKNGRELTLQPTTSWFESWRDLFLQIQYPSDHEFTKHFLACIIVISAGSDNAMEQLNKLSQYQHQQQHQNPGGFPKWFCPNILKFYILIHDVSSVKETKADEVFQQMTSMYGSQNCHLLHINSRPIDQVDVPLQNPDPWLKYLKQKGFVDKACTTEGQDTCSGTGTPREFIVELPSRVTEGDSNEGSDIAVPHPLSPVVAAPDNSEFQTPPDDVPLLNRQCLSEVDGTTQYHGAFLTSSDSDRIHIMVDEFCLRALIPYVERQIRFLNDVVTNRSKSKSLLSATRRWLGSSKQPSSGSNSVIYSQEASELQTRRLGDLCFMFGLYDMAYNAYYTAKSDFKSDQAWLYFAGAQEMAALSSFMLNPQEYPKRYLEGSLHTYLNVCKVYNFAIRLTLLSAEVLKSNEDYGEAAMMFIKMTSEESDLLSALMLEQAAHCFLNAKKPLCRKYAFHMTLAGHRFSKAGQRAHSYRAYKQAIEVYLDREWKLAEDHIHYSMGKQAFHLKDTQSSLNATAKLIRASIDYSDCNQISIIQQTTYVKEFLNITEKLLVEQNTQQTPDFPIPILDHEKCKVLLGNMSESRDEWQPASHVSFSDEEELESDWLSLEESMAAKVIGPSMIFRPELQKLTNKTPNTFPPSVPINEYISIEIHLKNPLLITLTVCNIRPRLNYFNENNEQINDQDCVIIETVSQVSLSPETTKSLTLRIIPQVAGRCEITGISFQISYAFVSDTSHSLENEPKLSVEGKQDLNIRGLRLNSSMTEKTNIAYANDCRLNIKVVPAMPRLSVHFKNVPTSMLCGQLTKIDLRMANTGTVPMDSLYACSSATENVWFYTDNQINRNAVKKLTKEPLNPGELLEIPLIFHAPVDPGTFNLKLLFMYEPSDYSIKKKYRIVRHLMVIPLNPSLAVEVKTLKSFRVLQYTDDASTFSSNIVMKLKYPSTAKSIGSKGKIKIEAVNGYSKSWKIVPYAHEASKEIQVDENSQLTLRCVNVGKASDVIHSSVVFSSLKDVLPCLKDFAKNESLLELQSKIDAQKSSGNVNVTSSLKEFSRMNMVLSLLWSMKVGDETIFGDHGIFLDKIGDSVLVPESQSLNKLKEEKPPVIIIPRSVPELTEQPENKYSDEMSSLVKVTLDYPTTLTHNFDQQPLCKIIYSIKLFNACGRGLETLTELSSLTSCNSSETVAPQPSTNILNVGCSTRKSSLSPWETVSLQSAAVVSAPGTYCLGAFTLKVKLLACDEEWIEQSLPLQTAVEVHNVLSTGLRAW